MSDWHQLDTTDVLARLGTDSAAGLTTAEADRRRAEHGPNELQAAHGVSPWAIFLAQLKNVLIIILIIAVGLSAVLGHGLEPLVIGVIVFFAVLLGFVQEYRAERAIQALRQMAAPTATVLRDGREADVPARDVVPGDVVRLAAGDRIPADARLIEAINLQTDEAALTGESLPVEKQTATLEGGNLPVGDRRNMVYSGTAVTYGRGRAVVVATGMKTQFGLARSRSSSRRSRAARPRCRRTWTGSAGCWRSARWSSWS
jgi:Ca2+-transporting ATPase